METSFLVEVYSVPWFLYVDIQLKGQIEHDSKDPLPCSADPSSKFHAFPGPH